MAAVCPHCNSHDTAWKPKARQWECQDCEQRFDAPAPAPEDIPDPLALREDEFRARAKGLADSDAWCSDVLDHWPAPIAYTYALLRSTLKRGQIDAAALVLKDFAELLARFSTLAMTCEIREKGPEDKRREVLSQLFAKPLTMGDWVRLADGLAKWLEAEPQRQPDWLTRPIARLWRSGKRQTVLGRVLEQMVRWRNETIGHGVRGSDLEPTMQGLERFLGADGENNLHRGLQAAGNIGEGLLLIDDRERALMGSQALHAPQQQQSVEHPLEPWQGLWLQRRSDGEKISLSPYLAVRRCEVCGRAETFHYDCLRPKKYLPDFRVLNYEQGHAFPVPLQVDSGLLEEWRRLNIPQEHRAEIDFDNDASIPGDVVELLGQQAIERGYLSPAYLRDPLWKFIDDGLDSGQGGLYWLRAPAHVGKSTFVQGLDPQTAEILGEKPLRDDLAVVSFAIRREYHYHLAQFADGLRDLLKVALNLSAGTQVLPSLDIANPSPQAFLTFLKDFQTLGRKPILVILDGLDELAEEHPGILDLLPSPDEMPEKVFLLLTSRPLADCDLWIQNRLQSLLSAPGRELGLEDPEYRDLLREYAEKTLQGKIQGQPLEEIFPQLLEQSDARFLYFRFLVDRLKDGDLKAQDLHHLARAEHLLPRFVRALRDRYANTPMGERIDRALYTLALAERAFEQSMQSLPILARSPWQGLPMPVLCEMVEGTPRMTPNLVNLLYLLKPLLSTWRGESDGPRYRLGIKGLEDLLREENPQALADLARRWVENLFLRQRQWLDTPEAERGEGKDFRGPALDWVLLHLDGLSLELDAQPKLSIAPDQSLRQSLTKELLDRANAHRNRSHHRDALQRISAADALLRWDWETEEKTPSLQYTLDSDTSLFLLTNINELQTWLSICERRGASLFAIGNNGDAIADFDRPIGMLKLIRKQSGGQLSPYMAASLAGFLSNLGYTLRTIGKNREAIDAGNEAIKIWEEIREKHGNHFTVEMTTGLAAAEINLGKSLSAVGQNQAALDNHEHAIDKMETLRNQLGEQFPPKMAETLARAYGNRGVVRSDLDQNQDALDDYERAIRILEDLHSQLRKDFTPQMANGLAVVYLNRGNVCMALGQHEEAVSDYEQAIDRMELLREQLGERFTPAMAEDLAGAYMNRGNVWLALDSHEKALSDYKKAISIWVDLRSQLGDQFTPEMANGLAVVYLNRGNVCMALGQHEEALSDYEQAIYMKNALRTRLGEQFPPKMANNLASSFVNRGNVRSDLGQNSEALSDYDQAISMWEDLRSRPGERFTPEMANDLASAYGNRGVARSALGQHQEALADYEQAIQIWEELRDRLGEQFTPDMAEDLLTAQSMRDKLRDH
ncbi:tetratricopeptide repeat protein [Acidithiobacillus acidisediminis]|uniref:tetratricopeptide repeat protein n=1 Tax=Acidithiobacillus acidisediminis TaxID=2937799 RepID=UPI00200F056B|nr:tetratricopeptide repeat protein [Acidithiobacillus sp. S30A2]